MFFLLFPPGGFKYHSKTIKGIWREPPLAPPPLMHSWGAGEGCDYCPPPQSDCQAPPGGRAPPFPCAPAACGLGTAALCPLLSQIHPDTLGPLIFLSRENARWLVPGWASVQGKPEGVSVACPPGPSILSGANLGHSCSFPRACGTPVLRAPLAFSRYSPPVGRSITHPLPQPFPPACQCSCRVLLGVSGAAAWLRSTEARGQRHTSLSS